MSVSQACGSMEIVLSLNLTPRKCIGYLTPIQAFFKGLGKDIQIRIA
jgi:IS30 family transposase